MLDARRSAYTGLNHQIPQKETDHPEPTENVVKPMENNVFCQSKKKTSQEILRLFEILQKALEKQRFQHRGRKVPGKATLGPPAPTPGISPMPYGNHWKNNGFRTSVKVERG